jgi:RHS repeat-associated protein
MSALARTTESDCYTRAANEDSIDGGLRTRTKYDYDGLGRRVSKTVTGQGTTAYLLDGDEEIAEYNGATLLRRYVTGPRVDDRIAHAEGSATTNPTKTYYHANHQGSVIAMTDGSGNLAQRVGYDEYGNGSLATGEQFGYAGRRYDPETGLYYYRARYYSPVLGRFLQVDPVGYKDNLNLYTYVGNDPVDKTDPSGKWAWIDDAIALGAGAIVGVAGQGIEDLVSGHMSSLGEYGAAAAGGAAAGEAALYAVPTLGPAGIAVAAAAGSVVTDTLKAVATSKPLDVTDTAANAGINAAAAFVPGAKTAVGSLAKQIFTKFERGQIKTATAKTVGKVAAGKVANDAGAAGAAGTVTGEKDKLNDTSQSTDPSQEFNGVLPEIFLGGK